MWVWGSNSSHALCVYGWIRRAGSTRHCPLPLPPPCHACAVMVRFGAKLVSRPQFPPSTSPLSTRHYCIISSQEREFSGPILSRSAFPCSCIKFAFQSARVPKIPGTRESETRNARSSLVKTLIIPAAVSK